MNEAQDATGRQLVHRKLFGMSSNTNY